MSDELKRAQQLANDAILHTAFPSGDAETCGLSKKEYAAIHLKVPMSGNAEIDAMIKKARRDELAAKCMQSIVINAAGISKEMLEIAYKFADTMIEEGEK